ncbi:MAG TPA: TlpA family protein disulfide reductase [Slackia equolifaciens]|uniref:TlpA family protein disulfide reductase n=1 Tax=Slackia equolifaciens TaxID=498718 RepID=A0A9D2UZ17_9ACTN|nr:TlpA family protein disulfide reductase [Slackia equolifaciens]
MTNNEQNRKAGSANPKIILAVVAVVLVVAFIVISQFTGGNASQNDDYDGMGSRTQSSQAASDSSSSEAPDVTLNLVDGTQKQLSESRGHVVILSFWATWCPYCIEEMPDIHKITEDYEGVEAILVNCGEGAQTVEDFMAENSYDFTWALDEDYAVQSAYPTSGIPYTLVIDAEGNVVQAFSGSKASGMYNDFAAAVEEAME